MNIGESLYGNQGKSSTGRPASITLGVVKENWNPLNPGTVKVLISTPHDGDVESDWMPVMTPYGGNGTGCMILPEVGTTVLVGYVDDNSVSPVVLGCTFLKKGEKKSDLPSGAANDKNSVKVFAFSNGTLMRITEDKQGDKFEVVTAKKQQIVLDDEKETVQIISKAGESSVELNGKTGSVTLEAKQEVTLKVGGKEALKLDKNGLTLDVSQLNISSQNLKCNASQTKLEGSTVEIKAQGTLKVESGGIAQVKGSMLKLN